MTPTQNKRSRRGYVIQTDDISSHGHLWVHTQAKARMLMWRRKILSRDPMFFPAGIPNLLCCKATPWQVIKAPVLSHLSLGSA